MNDFLMNLFKFKKGELVSELSDKNLDLTFLDFSKWDEKYIVCYIPTKESDTEFNIILTG